MGLAMLRRGVIRRCAELLLPVLALAFSSAPASARPHIALILDMQAIFALVSAGSYCVTYTYDANGNRTAQTAATIGSGGVLWGSGSYGCFLWHS